MRRMIRILAFIFLMLLVCPLSLSEAGGVVMQSVMTIEDEAFYGDL